MRTRRAHNDVTGREGAWRRLSGDDWAAFDALPSSIRRRIQEHAYDAWTVNALALWRSFLRQTGSRARAERRLLRHIETCEALERAAFDAAHRRAHGTPLPHEAARASVLRYSDAARGREHARSAGPCGDRP